MDNFSLYVKVNNGRPYYQVFGAYFFGSDNYNYDSDGNSSTFDSKEWTELYMCCRKDSELYFDICLEKENPLILEVSSRTKEYVFRIAYFLAKETYGEVYTENNERLHANELISLMGSFDLVERLKIAKDSVIKIDNNSNSNK